MELTTQAALARELGITRQRVHQLVKDGLPVRADGKLDAVRVRAWLKDNWVPDPSAELRRSLRASRRESAPAKPAVVSSNERGEDWHKLNDYGRGVIDVLNLLRHPRCLKAFEDLAVSTLGCDRHTAFSMADTLEVYLAVQLHSYAASALGQEEADVIRFWT